MKAAILKILFAATVLVIVGSGNAAAQDTNYRSKTWRDSAEQYEGRKIAYEQELYSYDLGMTFGGLPIIGEAYVNKPITGIAFFAGRIVCTAASVFGAVRLIEGKPTLGFNLGLLLGGIVGYAGLKLWELADIRHTVSERNEHLVEKFQIATSDIVPHSIRYPTKDWPDWVTSTPPVPPKVDAKAVIDEPLIPNR
ncbi:MAG TPA: hypothetical protein VGM92_15555 [Candidatus Kapabacteria bacterium]